MKLKNQTVLKAFMENLFERIRSLRWLVTEVFDIVCLNFSQVLVDVREDILRRSVLLSRLGLSVIDKIWDCFLIQMGFKLQYVRRKTDNKKMYRGERR